ncbi:MAG: ECF transporter S component [Bacilli bacterium]|nr:ECF transporter S component [Bacilli bacterium]
MNRFGLKPVQKITLAALMLALALASTYVAKLFTVPNFTFIRFSLTPTIILFSSMVLGPFYGMIVGAFSDLIPALTFPTGEFNFLITIVYGFMGVLPWILQILVRKIHSERLSMIILYSLFLVTFVGLTIFLAFDHSLDENFSKYPSFFKPLLIGLMFVVFLTTGVGLYFVNRVYKKKDRGSGSYLSPYQIGLISSVCELLLMVFFKSLAFYTWYNFLASSRWPMGFLYFLVMLLIGSPVNILLMSFLNSWLFRYFESIYHKRGAIVDG